MVISVIYIICKFMLLSHTCWRLVDH